jgi:hypothetical protein
MTTHPSTFADEVRIVEDSIVDLSCALAGALEAVTVIQLNAQAMRDPMNSSDPWNRIVCDAVAVAGYLTSCQRLTACSASALHPFIPEDGQAF